MIWSGLLIYWANAVYGIRLFGYELFHFFPPAWFEALGIPIRLAEGMAPHFFFMWFFTINGVPYVFYTILAIRAVLSMVNRTDTPLMKFYRKKKVEKGSGKAIRAKARKLLTIIFVMLKKDLDYWYLEDRLYNRKLRALSAAA